MTAAWSRVGCGVGSALMVVILFFGAGTAADIPLFSAPFDKVAHFVYYGVMAALLAHAVGIGWLWIPLLFIPLVGAVDEWHQAAVAGRYPSAWDWLADLLGAAAFIYAYRKWVTRKRASH